MPAMVKWEGNNAYVSVSDIVVIQDLLDVNNEILGSTNIHQLKYAIIDASNVTAVLLSDSEILQLAASDATASKYITSDSVKLALVTTDEKFKRLIEVYIEVTLKIGIQWELCLFDNLTDARSWVEM